MFASMGSLGDIGKPTDRPTKIKVDSHIYGRGNAYVLHAGCFYSVPYASMSRE